MAGAVIVVQGARDWPEDLLAAIASGGQLILRVDDVRLVPFFVLAGGVLAVVVDARALGTRGLLALRSVREHAPATAIVAVSCDAAAATVGQALDCGATAFVTWPAPRHVLAGALHSGRPS